MAPEAHSHQGVRLKDYQMHVNTFLEISDRQVVIFVGIITVNSVMVLMFMITIMIDNLTMGYIGEIGLLIDLFGELRAFEARTVQVKRCQWI